MNCMKCGVEIPADQVFCDQCLADMERHPVKPGTPVLLPSQNKQTATKRTTHKRTIKPEEQIAHQRKAIFGLMLTVIILVICLTVAILVLIHLMQGNELPFRLAQDGAKLLGLSNINCFT